VLPDGWYNEATFEFVNTMVDITKQPSNVLTDGIYNEATLECVNTMVDITKQP